MVERGTENPCVGGSIPSLAKFVFMKYIIGIDIGGTKISIVLATHTGKILAKDRFPTQKWRRAKKSIQDICKSIDMLLRSKKLTRRALLGIGIGVPGPVNPQNEMIERSPNLEGWAGLPIKKMLTRAFGCPVFVDNDANAAVLGEKYFGAGRGLSNFAYVTVSTGIGSGIVANGRLMQGASGSAGEFGHMTIVVGGEPCACGKRGCLETYASGRSIGKFAKRALQKGRRSKIPLFCKRKGEITGEAVSKASAAGDRLAIQIREQAADYLGVGLGNLMNVLNPERIILGGGVLERPDHFWKPMLRAVKREAWQNPFAHCKIVKTRLKHVGDLGAVAVVLERLSK